MLLCGCRIGLYRNRCCCVVAVSLLLLARRLCATMTTPIAQAIMLGNESEVKKARCLRHRVFELTS